MRDLPNARSPNVVTQCISSTSDDLCLATGMAHSRIPAVAQGLVLSQPRKTEEPTRPQVVELPASLFRCSAC
jgi:hypothetical protein